MSENEESIEAKDARLAALMHSGWDERLHGLFKSVCNRERWLPTSESAMASTITGLYAAFAHRRLSEPFAHCDHCVSNAMVAHWKQDPLKSLNANDLWAVMSNVPATAGTTSDVLYFTPRILEHAALDDDCILDLSWAFSSLQSADAPQTTDAEKAALRKFFEPFWVALRDADPPQHPLCIADIVLPTAVLTGEIQHYLDLWVGSNALALYRRRLANDAFWDDRSKAYNDVVEWLNKH